MARKPLYGTVAQNVIEFGTGALNIDGCRIAALDADRLAQNWDRQKMNDIRGGKLIGGVAASIENTASPSDLGRWPANVIHDGSGEVLTAFGHAGERGAQLGGQSGKDSAGGKNIYGGGWSRGNDRAARAKIDTGTAARFFYSAKADASDRMGSKHPTVKPIDLMAYLVRLVTPPGGGG